MGFLEKIKSGLSKTREQVFGQIQTVIFTAKKIDEELLEEIQDLLISGDVGVDTAEEIIDRLQKEARKKRYEDPQQLYELLKSIIGDMFAPDSHPFDFDTYRPYVILVVGVNGTGKTTSIAKMAALFRQQGKKVILAAADTFRAAAIEQLQIWAERAGADLVKHQSGSDPAAVVFDALRAARARNADVVLVDTAGRLHTKVNLMEELKKIKRVIQKEIPEAPHQTLLVLDATIGQNAITQAKQFVEAVGITGIVLTKLDGTAKGGAVIGISHKLQIPIKFVGLGEKMDDLQPFDPRLFVEGLFRN